MYNADIPFADAGADQENLQWDGRPATLDRKAVTFSGGARGARSRITSAEKAAIFNTRDPVAYVSRVQDDG